MVEICGRSKIINDCLCGTRVGNLEGKRRVFT